ncbi:hypothetical protein EDD15DRAFT_2275058 [Pisolithus albus]|nr:hypothetical protein EDD15DRAFT_2275058 [Pisolithus albus]
MLTALARRLSSPVSSSSRPRPPPVPPSVQRTRPTPRSYEGSDLYCTVPTPRSIRIGVRNKGCAGLSYHLEYVDKPGKFDEVVEQDGVKVFVDSRALFSIIGSEMDWKEDALSAKFVFNNPNIKDACGCGESFTVGSQP